MQLYEVMQSYYNNEQYLLMSETEHKQTTPESNHVTPEPTPEAPKKSLLYIYIGAAVIVLLIIFGVVFQLEKEGRSSTNFFSAIIGDQVANEVVATINGEDIFTSDLNTSIEQFKQVATSQGIDTTTADVQAEIQSQALNVLINTTLLKQEAVERGLTVSDEAVAERLEVIQTELGGPEVLAARLVELGIDNQRLAKDVKDEILIQQLLDEVFADRNISASDEELTALYDSAGGEEGGLPPFAEVRDQVELEVIAAKEQEVIDGFLTELKDGSEINILNE